MVVSLCGQVVGRTRRNTFRDESAGEELATSSKWDCNLLAARFGSRLSSAAEGNSAIIMLTSAYVSPSKELSTDDILANK